MEGMPAFMLFATLLLSVIICMAISKGGIKGYLPVDSEDIKKEWLQKVTDKELEERLKIAIENSSYEELEDAIYKIGFPKDIPLKRGFSGHDGFYLIVLMASKGKLPEYTAEHGIGSSFRGEFMSYQIAQENATTFDAADFVNYLLRKHGINEKMYIHDETDEDVIIVPFEEQYNYMSGEYVWEPIRKGYADVERPVPRVFRNPDLDKNLKVDDVLGSYHTTK